MRREVMVLPLFVLAAILVLMAAPVAAASEPIVELKVLGADGKPLTNVKVVLYDSSGKAYENVTNDVGVAVIKVPANGTYLAVVKATYIVLDIVEVRGSTAYTIDASTMHHVNVTSTPTSVNASIALLAANYKTVSIKTNMTVYAPSTINVSFPKEFTKFPFKYTLKKIKFDGSEVNSTTVQLDMTKDYVVTAVYSKTFSMTLSKTTLAILAAVLVLALVVAWKAGSAAAKEVISSLRRGGRFVRRK